MVGLGQDLSQRHQAWLVGGIYLGGSHVMQHQSSVTKTFRLHQLSYILSNQEKGKQFSTFSYWKAHFLSALENGTLLKQTGK